MQFPAKRGLKYAAAMVARRKKRSEPRSARRREKMDSIATLLGGASVPSNWIVAPPGHLFPEVRLLGSLGDHHCIFGLLAEAPDGVVVVETSDRTQYVFRSESIVAMRAGRRPPWWDAEAYYAGRFPAGAIVTGGAFGIAYAGGPKDDGCPAGLPDDAVPFAGTAAI